MKDREYSMDGKGKQQEEDEDSGKQSPFYSRDIRGGSMMENEGLGNEKQGIKPALQDSKRPKDLDLGYESLVETTVSDPPPHENSRDYSMDKGKRKQQKDSGEDTGFYTWDFGRVASSLMTKIKYKKGEGLGKNKQGIKHPIEATKRPQEKKLGLGYVDYDSLVNTTVSDPPPHENSWEYIQRLKDDEENMVSGFKEAAAEVTLPRPATKFTLSRAPTKNKRNPLPLQVITKLKKTIGTEDERSAHVELGNEEPASPAQGGMPGSRSINSFQKLKRIHEGPFGVVYKARDENTKEIVALKQIKMKKDKYQDEYGFPLTSLREINILSSCNNPSIVNMKEIVVGGKQDADVYMVMEYVEHAGPEI